MEIRTYISQGSCVFIRAFIKEIYFSAFFAAALTLNHVAWTVIAGVAIELGNSNRSKGLIAFILIAHFLCTGTSLLNNTGITANCFDAKPKPF